jgi:hypothetical protein
MDGHSADAAFELLKEKLDPTIAEQDNDGRYVLGDYDDMCEMLEAVEEIEAACIEFARSVNQTAARMESVVSMIAGLDDQVRLRAESSIDSVDTALILSDLDTIKFVVVALAGGTNPASAIIESLTETLKSVAARNVVIAHAPLVERRLQG